MKGWKFFSGLFLRSGMLAVVAGRAQKSEIGSTPRGESQRGPGEIRDSASSGDIEVTKKRWDRTR